MEKVFIIRNEYYSYDCGHESYLWPCANNEIALKQLQYIASEEFSCWTEGYEVNATFDELPEGEHFFNIVDGELVEVVAKEGEFIDSNEFEWRIEKTDRYFCIHQSYGDTQYDIYIDEKEIIDYAY